MFLLPPLVRNLFVRRPKGTVRAVFSRDARLRRKVREIAASQKRAEREVFADIIESGMKALSDKDKYGEAWDSLSTREQEVTSLICLRYRSYEIAVALGISYETVRSHSKHVYAKFGLSRKELQLALANWDFEAWWKDRQV